MVRGKRASRTFKSVYLALVLAFLYIPIVVMIALSFNASVSRAEWTGFTLDWYKKLFTSSSIMAALKVTLEVAAIATVISTVLGTTARPSAAAAPVFRNFLLDISFDIVSEILRLD